jgi:DNA-binding beta-propeller fold protein YncE
LRSSCLHTDLLAARPLIRIAIRGAVAAVVLAAAGFGCSKETAQPLPPNCEIDPLTVDFGEVLIPVAGEPDVVVQRDLSITNRVYVNSAAGNASLAGSLSIQEESPQEVPIQVLVVPVGRPVTFLLPPRATAGFKLEARVTPLTGTGLHTGSIDLGTPCGSVPYELNVRVREEPQPVLVDEWTARDYGFDTLEGIDVDDEGNVYVVDSGANRVTMHDPSGRLLRVYQALGRLGQLWLPTGVAAADRKFLFTVDSDQNSADGRVAMFDSTARFRAAWGPGGDPGGTFGRAWDVAADGHGWIYVTDVSRQRVLKFQTPWGVSFKIDRSWGTRGNGPGQFGAIQGVAADGRGRVYVSDWQKDLIQVFDENGTWLTTWGGPGTGPERFEKPAGLGVDTEGNVYVADRGNHRIQKFDRNGAFLTAWGEAGTRPGQMGSPVDVAVATDGRIYVADGGNARVEVFEPAAP